jgi:hypothetical protein
VDGWLETLPLVSKATVAGRLIQRVARALVEPPDAHTDV